MKIILTAFNGKLKSEPIEVPDNTTPDFYLPLPLDILAYDSKENVYNTEKLTMKKGHFRRTGKSFFLKDLGYKVNENENPFVDEYVLVDIS